METNDLTLAILQNIRDDIARLDSKFETRFDKVDARLDKVEARLDGHDQKFIEVIAVIGHMDRRIDRLHDRIVENDLRWTTNQHELQRTLEQIMVHLGAQTRLEERVERCERDIVDLKDRVF
jgi:chromosome segregation ATPase